jgi:hypothetical protein
MKRFLLLTFSIVVTLVVASCARLPGPQTEQAEAALQAAEAAGAQKYAPDAWNTAKQAVDRMNAELAAQDKKFRLFRTFKKARSLAEEATASANQAKVEADKNIAKLRSDVTTMIAELRSTLQSARTQLSGLPSSTAVGTASLRSRLNEAGRLLDQAQTELNAEQIDSAMASAGGARENIRAVLRAIEQAEGRPAAKKR